MLHMTCDTLPMTWHMPSITKSLKVWPNFRWEINRYCTQFYLFLKRLFERHSKSSWINKAYQDKLVLMQPFFWPFYTNLFWKIGQSINFDHTVQKSQIKFKSLQLWTFYENSLQLWTFFTLLKGVSWNILHFQLLL